jgi:hypothetical protein
VGGERGWSGVVELAALAGTLMSFVVAALREFGGTVLNQAQDDAAETTVRLGRRLLQRIFGTRAAGEPLPEPLADAVADPQDDDAVAALRLAIRKALAADPQLRAEVEGMLAAAGVRVAAVGERSIAAQTISGIAATGDNTTISR